MTWKLMFTDKLQHHYTTTSIEKELKDRRTIISIEKKPKDRHTNIRIINRVEKQVYHHKYWE